MPKDPNIRKVMVIGSGPIVKRRSLTMPGPRPAGCCGKRA